MSFVISFVYRHIISLYNVILAAWLMIYLDSYIEFSAGQLSKMSIPELSDPFQVEKVCSFFFISKLNIEFNRACQILILNTQIM